MEYGMTVRLRTPFGQAIDQVRAACPKEHRAGRSSVLPGDDSGVRAPGHLDGYSPPTGSAPRSNHGQTIKRPVTLSG
jgi:hypothetical protein